MSTEVKRRYGTTAQHAAFTGAAHETTIDTDKNTVVVHDNATPGGHPLHKEGDSRAHYVLVTPSSDADVALTEAQYSASVIEIATGSWTAGHNIIVPNEERAWDSIINSSAYTATVKTAAGASVAVLTSTSRPLVCDGTDVLDPLTAVPTAKASSADVIAGTDDAKYMTPLAFRGGALVSGTAIATTSGTSHDFTGIPSWAKKISVMLSGVSTNGTSTVLIQIGDSGGIETTGYLCHAAVIQATVVGTTDYTSGFGLSNDSAASYTLSGSYTLHLIDGTKWVLSGSARQATNRIAFSAGEKSLTGTLDRVRLTTVNGTDTFDAGSINIIYE